MATEGLSPFLGYSPMWNITYKEVPVKEDTPKVDPTKTSPAYPQEITREEAAEIEILFGRVNFRPGQAQRGERLRNEFKFVAHKILENCPASQERQLAMERLREAFFWAKLSIAVNE